MPSAHEVLNRRLVFGADEGLRLTPKNRRVPGHISETTVLLNSIIRLNQYNLKTFLWVL